MSPQNPRDMRDWMQQVERIGRQQRGIPAIVSGAVQEVREEVEQDKVRHPAQPIELTYQTAVYIDPFTGRKRVRFLLDFPDVIFNTDGTTASIQQYELWGRDETVNKLHTTANAVPGQAAPGATLPGLASTASNESIAAEEKPYALMGTNLESFFRVDDFAPNSVWRFRARAIGVTTATPGEWSEEVLVQMVADQTPPPQTTAPQLLVSRGTITVMWDGMSVLGAMPADFKYAVLAHGEASSPTQEIARFGRGGGSKIVADLEYYDPQFFRLAAVDESGNMGPWSEQAVGYTTPLVDKDIILSTIDAAKTHLKNIDAGVSILPNTIITEHLVVTEEMTAAIANFLVVNADMINANSIWADEGFFGLADALLFRGDAFEGKEFTGGIFTGSFWRTHVEEYTGLKWDASGMIAYAPGGSGVETFRIDATDGSFTANKGTLTGLKYQTHTGATQGIKIDPTLGFKYYNNSNQLIVDINASSSSFTGRVTSGFGAVKAILADNIYGGRPGVQFVTGAGYTWEPFITSYGLAADGSNRGQLYLSAGWEASNSNPGRLALHRWGGFNLAGYDGGIFTHGGDTIKAYGGSGTYNYFQAGPESTFMTNSGGSISIDANRTASIYATAGTTITGGLNVSGAKNFVMDHPTKPGVELLHGATESPVSGVEYWGHGVVGDDGEAVIVLPEYFEGLAKPEGREALVTPKGAVVDWGDVIDGKVTVYGTPGTEFSWLVKAERFGADFEVEREKVEWTPPGSPSDAGIQR